MSAAGSAALLSPVDIERRLEFADLVRQGTPHLIAAMSIGWTPRQLRRAMEDPEFLEMLDDAAEYANQTIEQRLYVLAAMGNMQAVQMWLFNRDPKRWRDVKRVEITQNTEGQERVIEATKQAVLELMRSANGQTIKNLQVGGGLDAIETSGSERL